MIKFRCENCGEKISVREVHAGKKGKCPKCGDVVIVPKIEKRDAAKERGNAAAAGRHKSSLPVSDIHPKKQPANQTSKTNRVFADGFEVTYEQVRIPDETAEAPVRKLPWLLDILLYPTSVPGLVNLGVFWTLPILLWLIRRILPIPIVWSLVGGVIFAYICFYFGECIRDSALGGLRAPENIVGFPDMSDAVSRLMEIVACAVVFWGPASFYFIFSRKIDGIFWLLLSYGIFFFPMGLLALVMFNSTSAFNPFLWIASIFSTFFQYCGLVLFFCGLGWLVSRVVYFFQGSLLFAWLFGAAFIYLAMVAAHLLGRFYYRNSRRLNWEV